MLEQPKNPINHFVCTKIRTLRKQQALTGKKLAELAKIPQGTYGCLENGFYRMTLDQLDAVLDALGVTVCDVWPDAGEKSKLRTEAKGLPREINEVNFFRFREIYTLSESQAACLVFEGRLRRILYEIGLTREDRNWVMGQSPKSTAWTIFTHRRSRRALSLMLKKPALEPYLEKLIEIYLTRWRASLEV